MSILEDALNSLRDPQRVAIEKQQRQQEKGPGIIGNAVSSAVQLGQSMLEARETGEFVGRENKENDKDDKSRSLDAKRRNADIERRAAEMRQKVDDWEREEKLRAEEEAYRDY